MKSVMAVAAALALSAGPLAAASERPAPYAGLQHRDIKALSPGEIDQLRRAEGMGFALAAELNGYPGPAHVLELGDALALSAESRARVAALRRQMAAEARSLGAAIIAKERALDRLFAGGRAAEPALRALTAEIGGLRGALRFVHLKYHIATRKLLSDHQLARYRMLRGYGAPNAHPHR